jgi:putative toxin-antitoxin system antitoxin component (TIGR02293 family)
MAIKTVSKTKSVKSDRVGKLEVREPATRVSKASGARTVLRGAVGTAAAVMVADPAVFSRYAGAELLGLPQTGLELAAVLEDGVDFGKLQILSEALAVTPYELAASIHLSSSTLLRRKREGRLQADESDRLVRLGQIVAKAIQLFEGDREAAKIWLNRPARALGGRTPLKHTQTYSGAQEVEDLIERLEEGIFS